MNKTREKNNPLFPLVILKTIVANLFGAITTILILDIADSFGLSTGELGGLLSANYVASVLMPLIAGRLGDLFGKKRVLIVSVVISILGSLIIAWSPTALIYSLGVIIAGIGASAENSVITPSLADIYPEKAARYITLLQVATSVAGMIGPLLVNLLHARLGLGWREQKYLSLAIMLIPYISLFFIRLDQQQKGKTARGFREVARLLSDPSLLWGALTLMLYCATDNTFTNFLGIFYQERFGAVGAGVLALTLHNTMYVIARFLVSFIRKGRQWIGFCSLGLSAVFLFLMAAAKSATAALIFGALYSFCFAPVYPFVISDAAISFPGNSATATSFMFSGGSLGCMLITLFAPRVAGTYGTKLLFFILSATSLAAMLVYKIYAAHTRKKRSLPDC